MLASRRSYQAARNTRTEGWHTAQQGTAESHATPLDFKAAYNTGDATLQSAGIPPSSTTMPAIFRRSGSLTIEDSFHRHQRRQQQQQQHQHQQHERPQQQQWRSGVPTSQSRSSSSIRSSSRKLARSDSRKLVRSSSISTDFVTRGTAASSAARSSSPAPKQKGNRQLLRSMVGFLSRTKSGKAVKPGSFTMTEPASPASAGSLSRTNSDSSAGRSGGGQDGEEESGGQEGTKGAPLASRPRVSFDADVTTVFIEQMKDEEVRKTFYCRREYAAFKEAYRTHRDTSTDWCRGNDVMPCNCDACQDDLVEGVVGQHVYSSVPYPISAQDDDDSDNYDSAFDDPSASSPSSGEAEDGNLAVRRGGGHADTDEAPSPVCAVFEENVGIPSPVGAVFQDFEEDCNSSGGGGGRQRSLSSSAATARHGACGKGRRAHARSRTWGMGSVPIAPPPTRVTHKRGGSLDDWGVNSSVREAVRCHGEGYAYKTLRLQGFSDLYIKTHFLPES